MKPTVPCSDGAVQVDMRLSLGPTGGRFERVWAGSFLALLGN